MNQRNFPLTLPRSVFRDESFLFPEYLPHSARASASSISQPAHLAGGRKSAMPEPQHIKAKKDDIAERVVTRVTPPAWPSFRAS